MDDYATIRAAYLTQRRQRCGALIGAKVGLLADLFKLRQQR
jgi:hypothetical protein